MNPTKEQQNLIDVILRIRKKAHPSESADLDRRARLFGGVLPQEIMQRSLEERMEKLEASKRKAAESALLTDRERKIWEVIQRGSRGLQYCRDLEAAHIKPRRKGVWQDCPRTYPAAYQVGEPWRHRIQDEKSRIKRKAEHTGLASE